MSAVGKAPCVCLRPSLFFSTRRAHAAIVEIQCQLIPFLHARHVVSVIQRNKRKKVGRNEVLDPGTRRGGRKRRSASFDRSTSKASTKKPARRTPREEREQEREGCVWREAIGGPSVDSTSYSTGAGSKRRAESTPPLVQAPAWRHIVRTPDSTDKGEIEGVRCQVEGGERLQIVFESGNSVVNVIRKSRYQFLLLPIPANQVTLQNPCSSNDPSGLSHQPGKILLLLPKKNAFSFELIT